MTEYEKNKSYAEKLSVLLAEHPDLRVVAAIDTDGLFAYDYDWIAGNMYEPRIETVAAGNDDMYHYKDDDPYTDCFNYYGAECSRWTDEEINEKAKAIPWEKVITVRVGVM